MKITFQTIENFPTRIVSSQRIATDKVMIQVEQDGNLDDYRITKGNSFLMKSNNQSTISKLILLKIKKRKNEIELVYSDRSDRYNEIKTKGTYDQNKQGVIPNHYYT